MTYAVLKVADAIPQELTSKVNTSQEILKPSPVNI